MNCNSSLHTHKHTRVTHWYKHIYTHIHKINMCIFTYRCMLGPVRIVPTGYSFRLLLTPFYRYRPLRTPSDTGSTPSGPFGQPFHRTGLEYNGMKLVPI